MTDDEKAKDAERRLQGASIYLLSCKCGHYGFDHEGYEWRLTRCTVGDCKCRRFRE